MKEKYFDHGKDTGNFLTDEICPVCGSRLYICKDGGSQGGAPYKGCINSDCIYIDFHVDIR